MKILLTVLSCFFLTTSLQAQNPYESIGREAEVLTLSNGKYQEFIPNDTVVVIGSVLYNTLTEKIVGFVKEDTVLNKLSFEPEVTSRWLSVDPLARKYPSLSPYNYTKNNPIRFSDPDGRDIVDKIKNKNFRHALSSVISTDWGKALIGLFASSGQDVFGHKFESSGTFSDHTLTFQENSKMAAWGRTNHIFDFGESGRHDQKFIANDAATGYVEATGGKIDIQVSLNPKKIGDSGMNIILGTVVHELSLHVSEDKINALVTALNSGDSQNIINTIKENFDSGGKETHSNFKNRQSLYQKFIDRLSDIIGERQAREEAERQINENLKND